jgi:hypothetical protein
MSNQDFEQAQEQIVPSSPAGVEPVPVSLHPLGPEVPLGREFTPKGHSTLTAAASAASPLVGPSTKSRQKMKKRNLAAVVCSSDSSGPVAKLQKTLSREVESVEENSTPKVNGKGRRTRRRRRRRVFLSFDAAKWKTTEFRKAIQFHRAKIDVLVSDFLRD